MANNQLNKEKGTADLGDQLKGTAEKNEENRVWAEDEEKEIIEERMEHIETSLQLKCLILKVVIHFT